MRINSDDDSLPYKKVHDSPSPEDADKAAENDQLATSPSPGFQYEAAQPLPQTYQPETFQPISKTPDYVGTSPDQQFPKESYPYNPTSPFSQSSPTPYDANVTFNPDSPTQPAHNLPSPGPYSPSSPTPGFSNFYTSQDVGLPLPPENQRQQPKQQWSGETEID